MITTNDLPLAEMKKRRKEGYVCADCGEPVVVFYDPEKHIRFLACQRYLITKHENVTRHNKEKEDKIRRAYSMDSTALTKMEPKEMVARINMAKFPQELTPPDKALLAQAAITYGFDPLMNEISIYQGRPFISIDGRYRKAQESGMLDGVESRPATKQEREDWSIPEEDYFFRASVYVKGASRPFVGWGRVFSKETVGKGFRPVESNPQRMAEKRAEAQALRKAFHIPLPSIEDIGTPDEEAPPIVKVTVEPLPEAPQAPPPAKTAVQLPDAPAIVVNPPETPKGFIDLVWLKESLEALQWADAGKYLKNKYKVTGAKVSDLAAALTREQAEEFTKEVQERLSMK